MALAGQSKVGRRNINFPSWYSSWKVKQLHAPKTNLDSCAFQTYTVIIQSRQPSDIWRSFLTMPETINFSQLGAGRMLTKAGWELSSTLQTAQLNQEKNLLNQLNRFTVQHFPALHNIEKKKKDHLFLLGVELKGCTSLLLCLLFNCACFPFESAQ